MAMPAPRTEPLLRREDARLLRGAGQFVGDLQPPGLLHAVFVRSAHAHGRVRAVMADDARALPGVVAVFTEADLPGLAMPAVNALIQPLALPSGSLLGAGMAAAVVARSAAAARQAADAVWVDIDELVPVLDGSAAPPVASVHWATGPLPTRPATARVQIGLPRVAPAPLAQPPGPDAPGPGAHRPTRRAGADRHRHGVVCRALRPGF